MNRKAWICTFFFFAGLLLSSTGFAEEAAPPLGPWQTDSAVNLQVFGALHMADHADVNNYINTGKIKPFGNEDWPGYLDRATPLYGLRLGMVFSKKIVADLQAQYYREYRKGQFKEDWDKDPATPRDINNTGALLTGFHFLVHVGVNLVERPWQLYPFVGLGWSYTNLVVNGDDRKVQRFPSFAGAKEGVPADAGIGLEFQNPIWTSNDLTYRTAMNIPIFLHIGYQGELITYFWQVKRGNLDRPVLDRFMGPYVRLGIGFGRGKYSR